MFKMPKKAPSEILRPHTRMVNDDEGSFDWTIQFRFNPDGGSNTKVVIPPDWQIFARRDDTGAWMAPASMTIESNQMVTLHFPHEIDFDKPLWQPVPGQIRCMSGGFAFFDRMHPDP